MDTYHINPFLKPANEPHPSHFEAFFAATAAAKEVVTRTKYVKTTACFLLVFSWDEDLLYIYPISLVIQKYALPNNFSVVPTIL